MKPPAPVWFSPELLPHTLHPDVPEEAREPLLRRGLARYLHTTVVLETQVVSEVAASITRGEGPIAFDTAVREQARQLHRDEARHARLAAGLLDGLDVPEPGPPRFLRRLDTLRAGDHALVTLLFTIGTETLLSAALVRAARDPRVAEPVRAFLAEHARDEAWHSAFFGARLVELWGWLAPAGRDRCGALLPVLLTVFLEPDRDAIRDDLVAVGLGDRAERVVAEAWSDVEVREATRRAVRPTMLALRRAGAFRGRTAAAFRAAGLVDG